jgi:hypothetical protein
VGFSSGRRAGLERLSEPPGPGSLDSNTLGASIRARGRIAGRIRIPADPLLAGQPATACFSGMKERAPPTKADCHDHRAPPHVKRIHPDSESTPGKANRHPVDA